MNYPVLYVPAGDVIPVMFTSYDGDGASVTLSGLAVTDVEIYKDGSVTQRASDAGYALIDTDGIDIDSTTGLHGFTIDTGDNTDSGFYTVGSWFTVVVSAVTIDTQTVTFIACMFRLMPAEGIAATPKVDVAGWLGTAAATPTTAGVPEVDVTHVAGSATTATLDTIKSDTAAILTDTADMQPKLGSPAADISADIAAVKSDSAAILTDTADIQPKIGTPSADLSADIAALNDLSSTEVGDAVLDEVVEGSWTLRQMARLWSSVLLGKISGAATSSNVFRDIDDTKNRVSATVDSNGNRTEITKDAT